MDMGKNPYPYGKTLRLPKNRLFGGHNPESSQYIRVIEKFIDATNPFCPGIFDGIGLFHPSGLRIPAYMDVGVYPRCIIRELVDGNTESVFFEFPEGILVKIVVSEMLEVDIAAFFEFNTLGDLVVEITSVNTPTRIHAENIPSLFRDACAGAHFIGVVLIPQNKKVVQFCGMGTIPTVCTTLPLG